MCRKWSFVDFPILVEMLDFFKGIHPGVVSEHCEHGTGYAPLRPITHRRFSQVIGCLCALVVGNFVIASMDITSSQIFESLAGLDQKTTSRQFYSSLLPVTSPNGKARILALAMDGEEADVTVELVLYRVRILEELFEVPLGHGHSSTRDLHIFEHGSDVEVNEAEHLVGADDVTVHYLQGYLCLLHPPSQWELETPVEATSTGIAAPVSVCLHQIMFVLLVEVALAVLV